MKNNIQNLCIVLLFCLTFLFFPKAFVFAVLGCSDDGVPGCGGPCPAGYTCTHAYPCCPQEFGGCDYHKNQYTCDRNSSPPESTPTTIPTPQPPGNLVFSCNQQGNQVDLSWDTVPNATTYAVRADDGNEGVDTIPAPASNCATGPNSPIHDFCYNGYGGKALTLAIYPGTTYTWWVHGVNGSVYGPSASSVFTCNAPTNTPVPTNTVTLTPTYTPTNTPTTYINPPTITPTHTSTPTPTVYSPTNTSTPTPVPPTMTPTRTPTVPGTPRIVISGAFEQRTGSFSHVANEDMRLPIDTVSISAKNSFFSSCRSPGSSQCSLTSVDASTGRSVGYKCELIFGDGCVLNIPVGGLKPTIVASVTSDTGKYYLNGSGTLTIQSPPQGAYTAPIQLEYRKTDWIKFTNTDVIRSTQTRLTNNIPYISDKFQNGDTNDPGNPVFIDGTSPGIVAGASSSTHLIIEPSDRFSEMGGYISSYNANISQIELQTHVDKLLRLKPFTTYTNSFANPTTNQIYVSNGQSTITSTTNVTGILISRVSTTDNLLSNVLIDANINPNNPGNSFVIIADTITIGPNVTEIGAVLIAKNKIVIQNETTDNSFPLKIRGNIVAYNGLENYRAKTDGDYARPTVLVVFSPSMYIDTLRLLSSGDLEYSITE